MKINFFKLIVGFLLFIGRMFYSKSTQPAPDTSWESGRKKIYDKGIDYWQKLFLQFDVKKNDTDVLEVGSGNGQWLIAMHKLNFARKIDAVEPNDKVREYSLKKMKEYNVNNTIMISKAPAEKLPYNSRKFDLVLCLGVFMFTDQSKSFDEFNRVLKPGGTLILSISGIGYYLMRLKNGIKYRSRKDIEFGLGYILRSINKLIFKKNSKNTFVTRQEMKNKFKENGFTLKYHNLWLAEESYPKKHFGFITNHLFIVEKNENN